MPRSMTTSAARPRGYTLLEVLFAMSILAVGLTVLVGAQANSARITERANRLAVATMLARSQMLEIDGELMSDGFSDMEEEDRGDFDDEGFENYRWESLVEPVEITPDAEEAFVNQIYGQLFGDEQSEGALAGASAVSQFLPMILAQIPQFINELGQRIRKVTLQIEWDIQGGGVDRFTVQQFVVNTNRGGQEGRVEGVPQQITPEDIRRVGPPTEDGQ